MSVWSPPDSTAYPLPPPKTLIPVDREPLQRFSAKPRTGRHRRSHAMVLPFEYVVLSGNRTKVPPRVRPSNMMTVGDILVNA